MQTKLQNKVTYSVAFSGFQLTNKALKEIQKYKAVQKGKDSR